MGGHQLPFGIDFVNSFTSLEVGYMNRFIESAYFPYSLQMFIHPLFTNNWQRLVARKFLVLVFVEQCL